MEKRKLWECGNSKSAIGENEKSGRGIAFRQSVIDLSYRAVKYPFPFFFVRSKLIAVKTFTTAIIDINIWRASR